MGKSTTAKMFADLGVPTWDADAAVQRLYGPGGAGVIALSEIYPKATQTGRVDKEVLKSWIATDPKALPQIEAVIHSLVAADRAAFIKNSDAPIVLLDIPLLFETGGESRVDTVVVVSAPADVQRARVLERTGMTEAHFKTILSKQYPDAKKRAHADYVIETISLDAARGAVQECIADIRQRLADA